MQVFRTWTQNTDELVHERPHKLLRPMLVSQYPGCRPSALPTGPDLLSGAPLSAMFGQGGEWSKELQSLFVSSMIPGNTGQGRHPCSMWPGERTVLMLIVACLTTLLVYSKLGSR